MAARREIPLESRSWKPATREFRIQNSELMANHLCLLSYVLKIETCNESIPENSELMANHFMFAIICFKD